jgi:predicted house-cleaning noncanonical NTP pyrophosphatase (MazG superfamily)
LAEVLRFRVEKLIRDKLLDIMRASGLKVFPRILESEEFVQSLKAKLVEEAAEVAAADTRAELLDELADVLEVISALASAHDIPPAELEIRRAAKHAERGGFEARIYNIAVEAEADCPAAAYYLARPEQYPRL